MKKFNYISILAGGSCKFNCDFCIGKDIRKNVSPHFSKKWQSFIECFGDMTDTLSISGDTSDPSFNFETWQFPYYVKDVLKLDLRVTVHTRNFDFIHEHSISTLPKFDSYVLSIDETFIDKINKGEVENIPSEIDTKKHYDLAIYDILSLIDFEDARENISNKDVYRIAVIDGADDLPAFENYKTDAWIYREKLTSFQKMLNEAMDKSYI